MCKITPIIFEENGTFAGYAAELPGAVGQGNTPGEVLDEIRSAVVELVEEYARRGAAVPWRKFVVAEPIEVPV